MEDDIGEMANRFLNTMNRFADTMEKLIALVEEGKIGTITDNKDLEGNKKL